MRRVFSSHRLENVEAAADLLRAEGIEVQITNGRSYRGNRRGAFSYSRPSDPETQPALWIVRAEDQPRGRELLRTMGLLESSREPFSSDALTLSTPPASDRGHTSGVAKHLRIGLLALLGVGTALALYSINHPVKEPLAAAAVATHPKATVSPPMPAVESITELHEYAADVPTALAVLIVQRQSNQSTPLACLTIDDQPASTKLLAALSTVGLTPTPATACANSAETTLAIRNYRTDGSGAGRVTVQTPHRTRELDVVREGAVWRVTAER